MCHLSSAVGVVFVAAAAVVVVVFVAAAVVVVVFVAAAVVVVVESIVSKSGSRAAIITFATASSAVNSDLISIVRVAPSSVPRRRKRKKRGNVCGGER